MNVLSLFAGIGGFDLGLERAGMTVVAQCECEPWCQRILNKHWPEVPIYDDVTKLKAEQLKNDGIKSIDLVCGGFPCQPFSLAGKRNGEKDDRHLWPEMCRIINETRPSWVIGENVAGIITLGLDAVLSDLESIGYTAQTFDISSDAAGLPTMERHIWIIATPNSKRFKRFTKKKIQNQSGTQIKFLRNHPREYERWALPKTRVCGVGERVSGWMDRIKGLGNAVPPQIPEIIGNAIMEVSK